LSQQQDALRERDSKIVAPQNELAEVKKSMIGSSPSSERNSRGSQRGSEFRSSWRKLVDWPRTPRLSEIMKRRSSRHRGRLTS